MRNLPSVKVYIATKREKCKCSQKWYGKWWPYNLRLFRIYHGLNHDVQFNLRTSGAATAYRHFSVYCDTKPVSNLLKEWVKNRHTMWMI